MEALAEASAVELGPIGGTRDLKDEIKILKGNLADAEGLIKKLKLIIARKDNEIFDLRGEVAVWKRTAEVHGYEYDDYSPGPADAECCECCDVDCVDEQSDAGDAM